jgi:hypothetical protein
MNRWVSIDTHDNTCDLRAVLKTKRTYNLSERTIRTVRELADEYRVAGSQDAVVELAVDELRRRLTDAAEAQAWALAREDKDFAAETREIESEYRSADEETWPG